MGFNDELVCCLAGWPAVAAANVAGSLDFKYF